MERIKRKGRRLPSRNKKENPGIKTGLLDCFGNEIISGSYIHLRNTDYEGPVLWNRHQDCFGICMGLWYGAQNEMDPECYGKFIRIPSDNGMRMELVPCSHK